MLLLIILLFSFNDISTIKNGFTELTKGLYKVENLIIN